MFSNLIIDEFLLQEKKDRGLSSLILYYINYQTCSPREFLISKVFTDKGVLIAITV